MARRIMRFLSVVLLLFGSVRIASAYNRDFGLGAILGEPTGISLKKWLGQTTAIDAAVAWSFFNNDSLYFHVDYLVHNFNLLKTKRGKLPLYYGIGGRIHAEDKSRVGVRIPVGLNYTFDKAPLDIFAEIGSVLDLVPSTEVSFTAFIGIRYFF
jgi:hypothetical protein